MFLRNERTPQTLLACLLSQGVENGLVGFLVGDLLLRGHALVVHPFAHALADFLGFLRNFEIDRHDVTFPCVLHRFAHKTKEISHRGTEAQRHRGTEAQRHRANATDIIVEGYEFSGALRAPFIVTFAP